MTSWGLETKVCNNLRLFVFVLIFLIFFEFRFSWTSKPNKQKATISVRTFPFAQRLMYFPASPWVFDIWGLERSITLVFLGLSAKRDNQVDMPVQRRLHFCLTSLKLRWFTVTIDRSIIRILMALLLSLGVLQSCPWNTGWIRQDPIHFYIFTGLHFYL